MSFLLQHSKRNKSNNDCRRGFGLTSTSGDRVLPPAKPAATRGARVQTAPQTSHGASGSNGYQSQQQAQLFRQRPPNYASQSQTQPSQQQRYPGTKQHQQSKKQQANDEKQQQQHQQSLTVSMAEVMEDLQILEQQQREAQRKLASARLTKEHKIQQQQALENQFGELKYSNGEMRAQICQARELLSAARREFGARRLASNDASDRIRAFDQKLRKALLSARLITARRRKNESRLAVARNKASILRRLQEEAKDKLASLERENEEAKQREDSLRKSIQEQTSAAQKRIAATATLRSENKTLDQELITAQTAAKSIELEADAREDEKERETRRHEEAIANLKSKIQSRIRVKDDLAKQADLAARDLDEKTQLLHFAWTRCIEYQNEEGHDLSPPPTDPQAIPPVFDMARLRRTIDDEDSKLRDHQSGRQQLQTNADKLRNELARLQGQTRANLEKAPSVLEIALEEQKSEAGRRLRMTTRLKELEDARADAARLLQQYEQSEKDRAKRASSHAQIVSEHKEAITRDREALAAERSNLEAEKAASEDLFASWELEKAAIQEKLHDAKATADESKKALCDLKEQVNGLASSSNCSTHRADEQRIKEESEAACEETMEEISRILQNYPELRNINFSYDPDKTDEQQADGDLQGVLLECQARLVAARRQRDHLEQEREESRRLAEAAAAEAKRKEEDRRKREELREAEVLRREQEAQEREKRLQAETQARLDAGKQALAESEKTERVEEERHRQRPQEDQVGRIKTDEIDTTDSKVKAKNLRHEHAISRGPTHHGRRRGKGADFFLPQSQEATIEDETPARPQTLLAAFTHANELDSPNDPPTFSSMNSQDKRVHWKDVGDELRGGQDDEMQTALKPNLTQERTSRDHKFYGNSTARQGKDDDDDDDDEYLLAHKSPDLPGMLENILPSPRGKADHHKTYQVLHERVGPTGVVLDHRDEDPPLDISNARRRSSKSKDRDQLRSSRDKKRKHSINTDRSSTANDMAIDEDRLSELDGFPSKRPSSLKPPSRTSEKALEGTHRLSSSQGPPKKRVYGSTSAGGRAAPSKSSNASVASGRSSSSKSAARSFKKANISEKRSDPSKLAHDDDPTMGEGGKGLRQSRGDIVASGRSSSKLTSRSLKESAKTKDVSALHDDRSAVAEKSKSTDRQRKDPRALESSNNANSRHQNQSINAPGASVQNGMSDHGDGSKSNNRSSEDSIATGRASSKHPSHSTKEASSQRASSRTDSRALLDVTNAKKAAKSKKSQGDALRAGEGVKPQHKSSDASIVSGRSSFKSDSRRSKEASKDEHRSTLSTREQDIGSSKADGRSSHRRSSDNSVASARSFSSKPSSRPHKPALGAKKASVPSKQPRSSNGNLDEGRKSYHSNASVASGRSSSSKSKRSSSSQAREEKKSVHDDASTVASKSSRTSGQSKKRSLSCESSAHNPKVRRRKKSAVAASKVSSKSLAADSAYDFQF